jgi:hypothetical protein
MFSTQNCGQDFDEIISESEEQKNDRSTSKKKRMTQDLTECKAIENVEQTPSLYPFAHEVIVYDSCSKHDA